MLKPRGVRGESFDLPSSALDIHLSDILNATCKWLISCECFAHRVNSLNQLPAPQICYHRKNRCTVNDGSRLLRLLSSVITSFQKKTKSYIGSAWTDGQVLYTLTLAVRISGSAFSLRPISMVTDSVKILAVPSKYMSLFIDASRCVRKLHYERTDEERGSYMRLHHSTGPACSPVRAGM